MIEPKIIYEDGEILVLDKPAGMVVNRAESVKGETVQEWLEKKLGIRNQELGIGGRAGIVHRLDKETSGLLLVAKTPEAFQDLQRQFKERKVKKTYLALVHGEVRPEVGEIRAPVGRLPWNRERFGVFLGGRSAKTRYRVVAVRSEDGKWEVSQGWEVWVGKNTPQLLTSKPASHVSSPQLSLLELYPQTGRTHQLRVHLKYAGHPIFGDPQYGGRKRARSDRKVLPRLFLHAAKISFLHPKTNKLLSFESPLPKELSLDWII